MRKVFLTGRHMWLVSQLRKPDPTNPSADCFQYHAHMGKEGSGDIILKPIDAGVGWIWLVRLVLCGWCERDRWVGSTCTVHQHWSCSLLHAIVYAKKCHKTISLCLYGSLCVVSVQLSKKTHSAGCSDRRATPRNGESAWGRERHYGQEFYHFWGIIQAKSRIKLHNWHSHGLGCSGTIGWNSRLGLHLWVEYSPSCELILG